MNDQAPTPPQVYLQRLERDYNPLIREGLEQVGFVRSVAPGSTVFLKPNLTFPNYRPGVMTSFECVRAVTFWLRDSGYRVIIGEADSGGYNRFSMDEVFHKMGLNELARQAGAQIVNISYTQPEPVRVRLGRKEVVLPLPRLLLHEVDAFITLPVPKIHMNTLVSIALKNQWGCIQEPAMRLQLHPWFAEVIYEICRRLPKPYVVVDGRYGLNESGPMRGAAVELNWLLVANDLVAADRVCCRLMQIDEGRVRYLRHFERRGWWTPFEAIALSQPLETFQRTKFHLRRAWTDYPGLWCFRSAFLAWLGYRSPMAGALHRLLYLFRQPFYDYDAERSHVRPR